MTTGSLWQGTETLPRFLPLAGDAATEVLIVGGGISGLTAALLLRRAGKRVMLIEARRIGAGETGHTTAHLTEVIDARYHVLESKFGAEGARAAAEASRAALDRIEALARDMGASSSFSRLPAYLYAQNDEQRCELEKELESLQRVGADAAWADGIPLPVHTRGAVRIEWQGQCHALGYLRGLAAELIQAGGEVFEGTRMLDVSDGAPCEVVTTGGRIRADDVLVLTNVPVSNRFAIHTKIAAYRTYAVAGPCPEECPAGLFWDMHDPYHYVRAQETRDGTYLIVGGEDHKTGQESDTERCFRSLEAYARAELGLTEVGYRWSGQVIEPADGLPFIGRNSGAKHVYVATGFSGSGMTLGTLSAMLLSDAVLGLANPWASLFDATRVKPIAQAREYVAENIDFPTHLARDRFARGEVRQPEEIPTGEGRLMRSDGKMLAVYRHEDGTLQACSAVCPHLGCQVQWNGSERSWDCPCHGSRFDVSGAVLNGPATRSLEAASVPPPAHAPEHG